MNPVKQFLVTELYSFDFFNFKIPITNSNLTISLISLLCILMMYLGSKSKSLIPTKGQVIVEELYLGVQDMLNKMTQGKGKKFFPFMFCTSLFIMISNLYGMIPFSFSITSQFVVTSVLALLVFVMTTIYGLILHKFHFFRIFLPQGTPLWLAPLMIPVEIFAYLAKPLSLSLRLAANMCAGHILIKVIASLATSSLLLAPFFTIFISGLMLFEIFVAILQAYIFAILACVYVNDVVNLH